MYNNTENKIVCTFFLFIWMIIFIGIFSGCSVMDRLNNSGRYDGLDGFGSEIVKHNEKNR